MPHPKVKISDDSGNAVAVTSNALDVNIAGGTASIDIGDVDLMLDGGTAVLGGAGAVAAGVLRVTLATDDTLGGVIYADDDGWTDDSSKHILVGGLYKGSPNVITDGDVGPLWITANGALKVDAISLTPGTGASQLCKSEDAPHISTSAGVMSLGVRNDTLASLVSDDGDYAPLQVNASGALYVVMENVIGTSGSTGPTKCISMGATEVGGNISELVISSGKLLTAEANSASIKTAVEAIQTAVEIIDDWDDSNYANVNMNLAGSDAPTGGGAESGALRVTIANDSTGVVTVDGTVTANLGTTDNAVLDAMVVDLAAMEALLITIDSDTDAIKTAVEIIDNAIDGSEMQVDIVAALPAGTNAIGKLSANSGVDIGDVTVDNLPTWFTNALGATGSPAHQAAEAYSALDAGLVVAVVCSDELAALSGVGNGEYSYLQVDTQGALYTTHGMTGMTHGYNPDIDATAEQLDGSTSGLDVACKRVDLMASADNTGIIYVGGSDTIGPLTAGMELRAGDFYSIDINNLNEIWVEASVANQALRYLYYT